MKNSVRLKVTERIWQINAMHDPRWGEKYYEVLENLEKSKNIRNNIINTDPKSKLLFVNIFV